MRDLIEALIILWRYLKNPDTDYPTACEHDVLYVDNVDLKKIPVEDVRKLATLGFEPGCSDDDYYIVKELMGEDFAQEADYSKITKEQWNILKENLTDCFYSYKYGSC